MELHFVRLCGFLLLITLTFCNASSVNEKLLVSKVSRTIDASSQLVKVNLELALENTDSSGVNSFLLCVDPEFTGHLAYIGAHVSIRFLLF